MQPSLYQPIPTCEIPMPVLDGVAEERRPLGMPRILLQNAARRKAERNLLTVGLALMAVAILEVLLLLRLPEPEPVVVYEDLPRETLLGVER